VSEITSWAEYGACRVIWIALRDARQGMGAGDKALELATSFAAGGTGAVRLFDKHGAVACDAVFDAVDYATALTRHRLDNSRIMRRR
jgi:hypothetical protein